MNPMKKSISLILAVGLGLAACSTGANKDFSTGLSVSYDGFRIDKAYLVGPDNTAVSTNEVPLNSDVAIVVQGIENYELKDEKAFPGLALTVMDGQGKAVIDERDLFADSNGYSPADAAILRGTVTVGDPMRSGETYHVKMRVWDKNKPANEINAEVDIVVK
jgi:hypothetical protein